MPERAINTRNATGFLLILLPAALAMSAIYKAWPLILGATLLLVGGKFWGNYQWSKMAQSINPVFQRLIVQNRGEITPIDLSLAANVSGQTAQRYLATKADEFGTGSRQHPDRGQVYYFLSLSTLGSIFDDSERVEPELAPQTSPVAALLPDSTPPTVSEATVAPIAVTQPAVPLEVQTDIPQLVATEVAQVAAIPAPVPQSEISPVETNLPNPIDLRDVLVEDPVPIVESRASPAHETRPLVTIIQSELAKRLDVHSSTIYKRRGEPNFTDWTRNRDPEGQAWAYAENTKEYYRVDS